MLVAPRLDAHAYLLEQIDDAAVVQLYADGFGALPLQREDARLASLSGGNRRPRHLLRPALRAQPRDARRRSRRSSRTPAASTRRRARRSSSYAKLFWINSGPHNNLTARKFVLTCTPEAFAAAAHAAAAGRRLLSARERRVARCAADPASSAVLRPRRRPDGDGQDAAARHGHSRGQRQQPVRRRDDGRTSKVFTIVSR